jgi:hypothetical protein
MSHVLADSPRCDDCGRPTSYLHATLRDVPACLAGPARTWVQCPACFATEADIYRTLAGCVPDGSAIGLEELAPCPDCGGSGHCRACGGDEAFPCPECDRTGACPRCAGDGGYRPERRGVARG